ncbi:MAG: triose-phosphate isomerase [Firmicutes bacterium]|nr:triose-phosphate isomerase [Bacillota bacterium]
MKIIAGNWKMNKTKEDAKAFFEEYKALVKQTDNKVIVCAPFTVVKTVAKQKKKNDINVIAGAQNVHPAKNGAFTGEISVDMLKSMDCGAVIIGHSERRTMFLETDEFINEKVKATIDAGMIAIFCIGETLEEREHNQTFEVLMTQINKGLNGVTNSENLYVAYEPVWAIGTGKVATTEQIQETHAFIKELVTKQFGVDVPVLYGGSANEQNCSEIFAIQGVDGALIGGASLVASKFAAMANYQA